MWRRILDVAEGCRQGRRMRHPSAGWISRRPGGGRRPGSAWIGWGSCPHETAHQVWLPFFDAGVSQGHHDGKGEGDAGRHPAQAADVMVFETEGLVEAGVDSLQGRASAIAALPGERAARRRGEDAAVGVERNADDAAVALSVTVAGGLAVLPALAVEAIGRRGAAVLESAPHRLEAVEGEIAFGAGLGTDTAHLAAFGVNDGIRLPGVERPGDLLPGLMAGLDLLAAPHHARIDDRTDPPGVPQGLLDPLS